MVDFPFELGNPFMQSIEMSAEIDMGTCKGWRSLERFHIAESKGALLSVIAVSRCLVPAASKNTYGTILGFGRGGGSVHPQGDR